MYPSLDPISHNKVYAFFKLGKPGTICFNGPFLDFLIEIYGPIQYWDEAGDHTSDAAKRTVI